MDQNVMELLTVLGKYYISVTHLYRHSCHQVPRRREELVSTHFEPFGLPTASIQFQRLPAMKSFVIVIKLFYKSFVLLFLIF